MVCAWGAGLAVLGSWCGCGDREGVGASLAVAREASAEAALFDVVLRVCVGGVWRAVSCEGVLQRLPFDVT